MSVFKTKKSPFYYYEFQINGRRISGSTRCTNRKEAQEVEKAERARAEAEAKATKFVAGSMQIDHVAARYWEHKGKHHVGADTTSRDLARLVDYFGPTKLLTEITGKDVMGLVAWRRGQRAKGGKALVANATVNRSTTEVLKKLFTFAKREGVRFERELDWKEYWLEEPEELVRELQDHEADLFAAATREDYKPLFDFVMASGLRQAECVTLKWSEVNFRTRLISKLGKGRRRVTCQITNTIREILWPLQGHHPEAVFTYVAEKTIKPRDIIRGQRYPMTLAGVKTRWRRMRAEAGVTDFRFHDFRHDFATKLLRDTGNLKMVQEALNHRNIKTSARYAHVSPNDLAAAMERVSKSREKPREAVKKAI